MNFKIIGLIIFAVVYAYQTFLLVLDKKSSKNPMPDNVKDIYNQEEFAKWQQYNKKKCSEKILSHSAVSLMNFIFIFFNVYSKLFDSYGIIKASIFVILFNVICETLVSLPFEWHTTMVTEQKFGFNKTKPKTFVVDTVKNFILTAGLMCALIAGFAALHINMGIMMLVLFSAIAIAFLLLFSFLYPVFSKIFNKFTPLEDGELKEKLTFLLEKHGYKVRGIFVMDASKRTTKSNAYFTGYGKMKTIVLYDTLLQALSTDEICAVFAHELGHGLHKDTLKNTILSSVNIVLMVLTAFFTVQKPQIFQDFGFTKVNYGMAFIILNYMEIGLISPLLELAINANSRSAEYKADKQAAKEGYGQDLISALKKITKENFGNLAPSELVVKLSYSHPTLSQRISALEK